MATRKLIPRLSTQQRIRAIPAIVGQRQYVSWSPEKEKEIKTRTHTGQVKQTFID